MSSNPEKVLRGKDALKALLEAGILKAGRDNLSIKIPAIGRGNKNFTILKDKASLLDSGVIEFQQEFYQSPNALLYKLTGKNLAWKCVLYEGMSHLSYDPLSSLYDDLTLCDLALQLSLFDVALCMKYFFDFLGQPLGKFKANSRVYASTFSASSPTPNSDTTTSLSALASPSPSLSPSSTTLGDLPSPGRRTGRARKPSERSREVTEVIESKQQSIREKQDKQLQRKLLREKRELEKKQKLENKTKRKAKATASKNKQSKRLKVDDPDYTGKKKTGGKSTQTKGKKKKPKRPLSRFSREAYDSPLDSTWRPPVRQNRTNYSSSRLRSGKKHTPNPSLKIIEKLMLIMCVCFGASVIKVTLGCHSLRQLIHSHYWTVSASILELNNLSESLSKPVCGSVLMSMPSKPPRKSLGIWRENGSRNKRN